MPPLFRAFVTMALLLCAQTGAAQVTLTEDLTGASTNYPWSPYGMACLTAGNNLGTIPGCYGLAAVPDAWTQPGGYGRALPDPVGHGALRLTDTLGNEVGGVISNFTFPSALGIAISFTSATYGGNGFSSFDGNSFTYGGPGADGMTFFLQDGTQAAPTQLGSWGGSLGYTCNNYHGLNEGLAYGYLGVGIDEYGNFSSQAESTATGYGQTPNSVVVRGAGNVTNRSVRDTAQAPFPFGVAPNLSAAYFDYYVSQSCATGLVYGGTAHLPDYPLLALAPAPIALANQESMTPFASRRGLATPITFQITITKDSRLSVSYSLNGGAHSTVLSNLDITKNNAPLPPLLRFGFAATTGLGTNIHEILCFKVQELDGAAGSATVNVQPLDQIQVGSQVYLAGYKTSTWAGQLTAQPLMYSASTNTVQIGSTAIWDASCALTGGACGTTQGTTTAQAPSSRNFLTWGGSAGVVLNWANLSAAQQAALGGQTSRLLYFEGDRSNEIDSSGQGLYRPRSSVLGDIIDSSPVWSGPPSLPYAGLWQDDLSKAAGPEGSSYAAFATNNAARANIVYVGSNDGFLHGFRAGSLDANGVLTTSTTPNDGQEVLAYAPSLALATLFNTNIALDYSANQYAHNAFVDATPAVGDLFYRGQWHTWLVGGLGPGGNVNGVIADNISQGIGDVFVLDVTDPRQFSGANAAQLVLGDWTSANLVCVNVASNCGDNMGNLYGTPIIRRLHDGNWAVLFGNGLNSKSGTAGLYVMSVNQASGASSFRFLDTGYGPSKDPLNAKNKNGIASVASADLDGDHITDYVYAGDAFGNLWRFDLTNPDPSKWSANSQPVYSATPGQPITTAVVASSTLENGTSPRLMVNFGTGQRFPQTVQSDFSYAPGQQVLLGVWDANMDAWNALGSAQYLSVKNAATVTQSMLASQTVSDSVSATGSFNQLRVGTSNALCWTSCNQRGWVVNLPDANEQVVYNPVVKLGVFTVSTTIPGIRSLLSCSASVPTGYTLALNPETGGAPTQSFFATATAAATISPGQTVVGLGLGATGSPSFVSTLGASYLVSQTVAGTGTAVQVNPSLSGKPHRVSWIKLR